MKFHSFSELLLLAMVLASTATISKAGANQCTQGTFFNGSRCKPCPPGTYQDEAGATSCKVCPGGTFNPFDRAEGRDICRSCPSGTFSRPKATACTPCPAGTNAPSGSKECISCPVNTFVTKDTLYTPDGEKTELLCRDCPRSQFTTRANELRCKPCPTNSVRNLKTNECKKCPQGTFAVEFGCLHCLADEFNDGSFAECQRCPPGYVANKVGGKCVPCPKGTAREYGSSCLKCKKGENSFAVGAGFCLADGEPCPKGYFQNRNGACESCDVLSRLDQKLKKCKPCGPNEVSTGGTDISCKPCPRAEIATVDGCVCRKGSGVDKKGKCRQCPAGYASGFSVSDRPVCKKCPPGSIAPSKGNFECSKCPPGQVQALEGQRKCQGCPDGLIANGGRTACVSPRTNCPPDQDRINLFDGSFKCSAAEESLAKRILVK